MVTVAEPPKKRFQVGLKGHKCLVYVDKDNRESLEVRHPVSEYRTKTVDRIIVEALSPGDAQAVFCKLQGILSSTQPFEVAECEAPAVAIKPAEPAKPDEGKPGEVKPAPKGGAK